MIARFLTLVFSLVVGITPIAPEVCELLCASSMPAHHMAAENTHDACGPQVSQVPACCADADRPTTPPTSAAKIVINPPTLIARTADVFVVDATATTVTHRVRPSRPPIPLSLRTPLRV